MSHEVRCAASLCALAAISAGAWLVLLVVAELLLGGGAWLVVVAPLSLVGLVASIRVLFTGVDVHPSSVVVRNVWRTYTIADEDLRSASIEPSSNWVVSLFAFNCRYTGPDRVRLELRDGAQVDVFVLATTELWRDGDLAFHRGPIEEICRRFGVHPSRLQPG